MMECMECNEKTIISTEADIVVARQKARELARELGFSATDQAKIATAVSELARNIVVYAQKGEIVCRILINGQRKGIEIVARDQGPGIANIELALTDGISTSNGLGIGLPGARRLMGELHVESASGQGTSIMTRKWLN
ncbi:MAG: anti-sigma regulatory factor [Syntrophomonadaceae bacterium]|nr:anti-sigma regulatory factor [Syntrophomonadaceae bacterium]